MFAHGAMRPTVLEVREYGGYFYTVNKVVGETLYLTCKEKRQQNCNVTAKISDGHFESEGTHTHPINHRALLKKRFTDAIYIAVTSSLRSFRSIYDEVCERDPEGAAEVPFISIEKSMLRWRKINCPDMPKTLANYAEVLRMEQWQSLITYNGGQLNVTAIEDVDGSTSVVYADIQFLNSIVTSRLNVDSTFAVCPRKPKVLQLLTIMAQIDDATLPIVWALMERKTYNAYVSVLQHFSTVLAPHIRPTSFMTDFESGLSAALQVTYPEAIALRCYFHYCQALMKRAKKEGLLRRIRYCEDLQIVFRKLMALALLPAGDMVTAFQWIVTNTPLDIAFHFAQFFQYVNTYWLNTVTPEGFTVFGMKCKTNNAIEAYHRVLRIQIGVHPSIWQFTEKLCSLQSMCRNSITSLAAGIGITRPSAERHIVQYEILSRAWDFYSRGSLDIPRFLACASSFLRAFNPGSLMTTANHVNLFVANEDNENRIQVLMEENIDDIYVVRQHEDGREEVIVLPGLAFKKCTLCGVNSTDIVSLPCCHWFACVQCTTGLRQLAAAENADIRCSICAIIVKEFHQIIIAN